MAGMTGPPRVNGPLALVLGSIGATAILLVVEQETVRASGPGAILFALGCLVCLGVRCGLRDGASRGRRVARDLAEYVGLLSAFSMIGAVASYPDAAATSGLVDPLLEHADRLLHFDWVGLYLLTARHPALQVAGAIAYQSIYVVPAMLFLHFAWCGRRAEAHRFLVSFWLSAVITLILFRWLPAAGPLALLPGQAVRYMPQSALYQAHIIPMLQQHRLRIIDLDALHGLVSAPSFHAASGVIYILFARKIPGLRGPLIGLSLLMLAATPVEGTHYLVDIIAGMGVAMLAYAATRLPPVNLLWEHAGAPSSGGSALLQAKRQHA